MRRWSPGLCIMMGPSGSITLALIIMVGGGCTVYRIQVPDQPTVGIPDAFSEGAGGGVTIDRWWAAFDQPGLSRLVDQVIANNLSLQQAWARLAQADALARIAGAEHVPQINAEAGGSRTRIDGQARQPSLGSEQGGGPAPGALPTQMGTFEQYLVGGGLSYEIDLWRRISSQRKASALGYDATREDLEAAALSLAARTADLWFTLQEQFALRRIMGEQIVANRNHLELLELRFNMSQATALDVYQQRQQLAAIEAQVPQVEGTLRTIWHQLLVLQGKAPVGEPGVELASELHPLPALPALGAPAALLANRPDLRSSMLRLQAADHNVAAAVAERYPRIQLSLSSQFSADSVSDVLDTETRTILGNLLLPLVDGGRRRAVVEQRKAMVMERLAGFNEAFLVAVREVEDALVQERYLKVRIEKLAAQENAARNTHREAQSRYRNGLSDYLPVIAALQVLQRVELEVVSAEVDLRQNRVRSYAALGGTWTRELEPPESAGNAMKRSGKS